MTSESTAAQPETEATLAIRKCLAACTQAGDARKAQAYAQCFTSDGVLDLESGAITGREAIAAWMAAPSVIPPPGAGTGGENAGFISHHLTTCHIEILDETSARARTYWLVTSASGLDHNGYYVDRFKLEPQADGPPVWRIAHRRPRTLWISPQSVLHGAG